VAFIECQGLAAWIAAGPPGPTSAVIPAEERLPKLKEPPSLSSGMVLALVDLVLSNGQEEQDGRANE
jgi:hypothetical protein